MAPSACWSATPCGDNSGRCPLGFGRGYAVSCAGMLTRTALLRLLLSMILMSNGIASAMAAVQHAAGPGVPAAGSEAPIVAPAAGAHDGCTGLDPGLVQKNAPSAGNDHAAGHSPGADCCAPGTCQCACTNAGLSALLPHGHNGFGKPGQACPRPTASWRPAPVLPHPMRPPIS
jgi:hypothetical protein